MRIQIYIARRSQGVWQEAREAAKAAELPISDFVALALRTHIDKLKRQAAREARAR